MPAVARHKEVRMQVVAVRNQEEALVEEDN